MEKQLLADLQPLMEEIQQAHQAYLDLESQVETLRNQLHDKHRESETQGNHLHHLRNLLNHCILHDMDPTQARLSWKEESDKAELSTYGQTTYNKYGVSGPLGPSGPTGYTGELKDKNSYKNLARKIMGRIKKSSARASKYQG